MNLILQAAFLTVITATVEPEILLDPPQLDADGRQQLTRLLTSPRIEGEFIVEFGDAAKAATWQRAQNARALSAPAGRQRFLARADDSAAQRWAADDLTITVIPNLVGKLAGVQTAAGGVNPGGLNRIDQRASIPVSGSTSYQYSTTGRGAIIYVLDDAILATHTDFASLASDPRTVTNAYDATGGLGTGIQTAHGTQMASIAGGLRGGVAKGATIKSVDVVRLTTWGAAPVLSDVLAGLAWVSGQEASNPGPAVVNMSFEFPGNTSLDNAVNDLANNYNVVMVSAAGNDAADASNYSPARAKYSLTVGNLNHLGGTPDSIFPTSNFGSKIIVFAPGVTITAADTSSITAYAAYPDGTSQAAAHVSGIAARYLETHPTPTPSSVIQAVRNNATMNAITGTIPPGTANRIAFSDFTATRINTARLTSSTMNDQGNAIAFKNGSTFVGGSFRSGNTVPPCATDSGSEGFVAKYGAGAAIWTTILNPALACGASFYTSVAGLAVDSSGDVYAAVNVTDFVGGFLFQGFLFKLSGSTGAVVWSRQIGANATIASAAVSIDVLSRVSFIGYTTDTIAMTTALGGTDGIIITFDLSGTQIWAKKFGSTSNDTVAAGLVSTAAIYVAGFTQGLISGAKDLAGTSVVSNAGGSDAFVFEIRADGVPGTIQRVLQFGGSGNDSAIALARRGTGLAIAGNTSSVLATPRLGGGGQDGYWVTVDSVFVQSNTIQQFGTAGTEAVTGVFAPSLTGDVFVSGTTDGSFSFGTNPGGEDAFISKYASNAAFLWDWQSLGSASEKVTCLTSNDQASDGVAELYLSGSSTTPAWPTTGGLGGEDAFLIRVEGY